MSEARIQPSAVRSIVLLGSYVPRQCGIATFTKDLRDAIAAEIGQDETTVLAMDDGVEDYDYPPEVRFQIPQHKQMEYVTAADVLNINQIDAAIIQHEFGIYGGRDGAHVLELVRQVRAPIITTLHTVLLEPSQSQRVVLKELARLSDRVVVMSQMAQRLLLEVYGIGEDRIELIPHGIPDVPLVDTSSLKPSFGVEGRTVLLTFGLLSPGKGIEVAIRAMPRIIEKHPEALYIILGATHPHVLKSAGNAYRNSLERLVDQLGLDNHVVFHNRFVSQAELFRYLKVADIYITPYPNKQQITSGTLAYAVGTGKAVVSTPYWHAEELLAEGRGRLFPFGDSDALVREVLSLLDDPKALGKTQKAAYAFSRPMVWRQVARSYLALAADVVRERLHHPRIVAPARAEASEVAALPDVNLAHMRRLTDFTGILQHAIYAIPNRHHGYCTDDNCRALIAALMHYEQTREDSVLTLADTYLSFIHHAFNPQSKRFRNFMSYDRSWLEEVGSEDVHGRTLWALGSAALLAPNDAIVSLAVRLFHDALDVVESFTSPRAWAFALVGLHKFLARFSGDTVARRMRQTLAERLFAQFRSCGCEQWPWCEDLMTYDNAKLAHALVVSGREIGDQRMVEQGLRSLEWLVNLQVLPSGRVSLIGNLGWLGRDGRRARFDQQPIEAMALVEACAEAYRTTQLEAWSDRAQTFLDWFTGNNDLALSLYDYQTGGCRDGLHADGTNLNQGAESTLAWLISLLTIMELHRERVLAQNAKSPEAAHG